MRGRLGFLFAIAIAATPILAPVSGVMWGTGWGTALAQKPSGPPTGAPSPPPRGASASERSLEVVNRSDTTVRQVFIFQPAQAGRSEGPDRLGTEVLPTGRSTTLRLGRVAQCQAQLRAIWEDATEETVPVNICTAQQFIFTDERRRDISLANNTDNQLTQLFIFERGSTEPGPDRLGAASVPPNDSFRVRIRGFAACQVTVRAAFQNAPAETRQVDICAEPRLAFGDASVPLREVTVTNRSSVTLQSVFASRTPGWGADRLGEAVLEPGQSFPMRLRSAECQMRMRAVFQNRREEVREAVDVCAGQPVVFLGARRLALGSVYERPIQGIYLSAVEAADWGGNQLAAPLANGGTAEISQDGGCQADLRVVFDNNAAEELRSFDMCRNAAITLRPGWVTEARP